MSIAHFAGGQIDNYTPKISVQVCSTAKIRFVLIIQLKIIVCNEFGVDNRYEIIRVLFGVLFVEHLAGYIAITISEKHGYRIKYPPLLLKLLYRLTVIKVNQYDITLAVRHKDFINSLQFASHHSNVPLF